MREFRTMGAALLLAVLLSGCAFGRGTPSASPSAGEESMQSAFHQESSGTLETSEATEDLESLESLEEEGTSILREESEIREGSSEGTLATPSDFPESYRYGSGRYSDWEYSDMYRRLPEPEGDQTVWNTAPDLSRIQALYLWEEGNVPAQTEISRSSTGFDSPDFRPYLTAMPVREGTEVKGAVVLLAGGAFQFRGNYTDTLPTAAHLRELGYHTFIVDYRLRPYTQEEGALDVAWAVQPGLCGLSAKMRRSMA